MFVLRIVAFTVCVVLASSLAGCHDIKSSVSSLPQTTGRLLSGVTGNTGPLSGGTQIQPGERVDASANRRSALSPPVSSLAAHRRRATTSHLKRIGRPIHGCSGSACIQRMAGLERRFP